MVDTEKIRKEVEVHYKDIIEKEIAYISDYLVQKELNVKTKVPDDKIVMSAEAFSKIVNLLSIAENNGTIEKGIMQSILDDVKETRNVVETINAEKTNESNLDSRKTKISKQMNDWMDVMEELLRRNQRNEKQNIPNHPQYNRNAFWWR